MVSVLFIGDKMLIIDIDKFIDMIADIVENDTISCMHQNYFYLDKENLKANIKIALDRNTGNIIYCTKKEEKEYLQ